MNCNSRVVWVEKRRKGTGKPYQAVKATYHIETLPSYIPEEAIICNGKIEADIELDYGYGCNCCSGDTSIVVTFKCLSCGQTHFPGLPKNVEQLNAFLTEAVSRK
jgi:hypothetical protein